MDAVYAHADEGYPYEICGFMLARRGSREVTEVKRARNATREDPRVRYDIAFEDLRDIDRYTDARGLDLVGFYHSHPDHPARASITDESKALAGQVYLIVSCQEGRTVDAGAFIAGQDGGPFHDEPIELS